jgi:hypothetical protein
MILHTPVPAGLLTARARTHKWRRVAKELDKLGGSAGSTLKMNIMAGRDRLCINRRVRGADGVPHENNNLGGDAAASTPSTWSVCGRGAFFDVELFVLSMGFALSVFIAHSLALAVARRAAETTAVDHDARVDNLVWAGPPANLRRTAAELERLRGSAAPALHEDTFEFLGLEFSLRKKVVVPSAFAGRLRPAAPTSSRSLRCALPSPSLGFCAG